METFLFVSPGSATQAGDTQHETRQLILANNCFNPNSETPNDER
jgi:hypothetical protein